MSHPAIADAALFARKALHYLAEQRLPPTPEQYRLAWRTVGGPRPLMNLPAFAGCAEDARRSAGAAPSGASDDRREAFREKVDVPTRPSGAGRGKLLAEMSALLVVICDAVPVLLEEQAWVHQQFDTLRKMLLSESAHPDPRAIAEARALLEHILAEQRRMLDLRRESLQRMKEIIAQCVEWLRGLSEASDRFGARLEASVTEIRGAPDLPSLVNVVRTLIDDTHTMSGTLDASRQDFLAAGARALRLQEEMGRLVGELKATHAQLMRDHLTGLANRRGLEQAFESAAVRCREETVPLSLALIDIDNFKQINDALGHQAGDEVLRHLAGVLRNSVRPADLGARYGGEEFVVLMPGLASRQAAEVIRRIQRALAAEPFVHEWSPVFLTFSAGVSQAEVSAGGAPETLARLVAKADAAMYEAKRAGKNRVATAD